MLVSFQQLSFPLFPTVISFVLAIFFFNEHVLFQWSFLFSSLRNHQVGVTCPLTAPLTNHPESLQFDPNHFSRRMFFIKSLTSQKMYQTRNQIQKVFVDTFQKIYALYSPSAVLLLGENYLC